MPDNSVTPKTKFQHFVDPISTWSLEQFGDNRQKDGSIVLDYAAAVLGMQEELGEFHQAWLYSQREDAIADLLIYLADFCGRLEIKIEEKKPVPWISLGEVTSEVMQTAISRVSKVVLKRVQGIRGYDDPSFFRKKVVIAANETFEAAAGFANRNGIHWLEALSDTWLLVSARDWKKNKQTGDGNEYNLPYVLEEAKKVKRDKYCKARQVL
jgi:NTP pyrophosphatase (non-canonical NTP hydrolase)